MTPEQQERYEHLIKILEPFTNSDREIESDRFFAAQLELAALIQMNQRADLAKSNGGSIPKPIVRAYGIVTPPKED